MKINLMKPHPTRRNQAWAVDFAVLDAKGRPFVMIVVDVHTRLPLSATVSLGLADDFTAILDRLSRRLGFPEEIWIDGGRHAQALQTWAEPHGISVAHGPSPQIRAVTELRLRDLCMSLLRKGCASLMELGHEAERWRQSYPAIPKPFSEVNQ
ncbi:DDE-type integrase/transposase/recombinase [Bradyrhizobium diazoefficiens]|uniref:DDE-type integrase/transposase/recombinase n=1 Tax=Bradyrhizobium diazoefficiens TaxID=1355477 RepID=UPI00272C1023|nr:DDE-type integrase/transposase/recombinase [Bradyrhizobium diazoefficiens]WLA64924.1 DDE-type integrase/transposase/recombinase [Bradyrhizobium diazoefficiens]